MHLGVLSTICALFESGIVVLNGSTDLIYGTYFIYSFINPAVEFL